MILLTTPNFARVWLGGTCRKRLIVERPKETRSSQKMRSRRPRLEDVQCHAFA